MAEAYFNKLIRMSDEDFEVRSAGTLGIDGSPPSLEVIKLLKNEGIDSSGYISKGLSLESIQWADIILVMAPEHRVSVLGLSPDSDEKIRYLGEFSPSAGEVAIPDPIGRSMAFYRSSLERIKNSCEELMKWLKK